MYTLFTIEALSECFSLLNKGLHISYNPTGISFRSVSNGLLYPDSCVYINALY